MSKVKYHINPDTGRPNQCHATVRDCKYAVNGELPEHYETKEEAKQAAEKLMNNKHGVTNTLKKGKDSLKNTEDNDIVKTEDKSNGISSNDSKSEDRVLEDNRYKKKVFNYMGIKKPLHEDKIVGNVVYDIGLFYGEDYYPGCEGCQPGEDDISSNEPCRCRTYTGYIKATESDIVKQYTTGIFNSSKSDETIFTSDLKNSVDGYPLSDEEQMVAQEFRHIVEGLLKKHRLTDTSFYTVNSEPDYYGEEIENVEINDKDALPNFIKDFNAILKTSS